ncbi:glycosyltransferase [Cohnella sp. REN36]|uniref:glycosyltransferase n=1 Tax=Cohnella sp. REN36 TaxID=2887347 RepID=UPI001D1404C3|nr:glycosyltransferase [Cohnella sp. REN36]MCC3374073.1 glycosyltransferase [Cohnella sp. REN36]
MRVSVCLIVRNEEQNLPRALASIPMSFETVVVDTGSTDRTVQIAEEAGAILGHYHWNDDFAAARNYCASLATGDYLLAMDADEELPADTAEKVNAFVGRHPYSAGAVILENVMGEERPRHRMMRFYPNDLDWAFHGNVHEQIYYKGEPASFENTALVLRHYGYEEDEYARTGKAERYIPLYERRLASHPNDAYMLYQFGKLLYSLNRLPEAERYLRRSFELQEYNRLYFPVMAVMLGYVLKEQGRSLEAEQLLKELEPLYPDFPDLYFLLGSLAMDTGGITAIQHYYTQALNIGETDKYTSVQGVGSYKAAYNLGVFYEITGNTEMSVRCYTIAADYGYGPARNRLK